MRRMTAVAAALVASVCLVSCNKEKPVIQGPIIGPVGGGGDSDSPADVKVGQTLPAWKEGELDIHFINTTAGECVFVIFPDATQMLIDAAGSQVATGSVGSTKNTEIRSRWDPTKGTERCGQFISDYLRHCMAWTGNQKLDYIMLTHLHNDHFGGANGLPASSKSSTYTLQSLPEIMDNFQVGKLVDRGYPDYDYPFKMATMADNASNCANYIKAVKWHVANSGMKAEIFKAGSNSQFPLVHKPSDYQNVRIQNLAVNGEVWTGTGTSTTKTFPDLSKISYADSKNVLSADNCPEENHCSAMVRISYGDFDFFEGGDAQYDGMSNYGWKDIETAVAKVCGKVEVMKADHHGTANTNGYGYKDKAWAMRYFQPQVWVVCSWTDEHPRKATFEGVTECVPGMDAYITNFGTTQQAYTGYAQKCKAGNGHVVVRVAKGGKTFRVYTLTDSDKQYTVKYVSGTYQSRQ